MPSIVTWNINSIKARISLFRDWLRETQPDIVLLQETKCEDSAFPALEIEELGYNIALFGQKTYNGVAILSKYPLEDITRGLDGEPEDAQARYIEAVVSIDGKAVRVASVYVPNGQEVGSDKFAYKLRFFERLRKHLSQLLQYEEICVIGGDYNVAPFPIDVHAPAQLDGTVCYHPEERRQLRSLFNLGYYDAYRLIHPDVKQFSWWDYRGNAYERGHGMRIDHLALSAQAVDRLLSCHIDENPRQLEKPSDHAPVVCQLSL
jgi:exodeoxyribonuclease-3